MAQVLHVRLGSGVADDGVALGQHGGHDGVFGAGDAHLVEQDIGAVQAVAAHLEVVVVELDLGAQCLQRQQVRIDAAPADAVAAGQGHGGAAEAAEHRAGQQHGAADLLEQIGAQLGELGVLRAKAQRGALVFDGHAHFREQEQHRAHVADARHVVQGDALFAEQHGRQDRQGGVLVPRRLDIARERLAAFDHELLHGIPSLVMSRW